MKPMREYPPAPQLTPRGTDDAWSTRTCNDLDRAWLWDYEIAGEASGERKRRHELAASECAKCPVLNLCKQRDHTGAAGVIAGEVVIGP